MSAYIVNKKHIDALVSFGIRKMVDVYDPIKKEYRRFCDEYNVLGQALVDANYLSVNGLYGHLGEETPYEYKYAPYYASRESCYYPDLAPVAVIKACHGYNYQACEADNYEESLARSIIKALEYHAINMLDGYEEAKWSID